MEHNMVASSRIYDNVTFKELGMLLQIPCKQASQPPFDDADFRLVHTFDDADFRYVYTRVCNAEFFRIPFPPSRTDWSLFGFPCSGFIVWVCYSNGSGNRNCYIQPNLR